MAKIPFTTLGLTFFLFLLHSACGSDVPVKEETPEVKVPIAQQIPFRWETVSATRNGKPTASLEGLFFDFSKAGFLTTNLMGVDQTMECSIDGHVVKQLGDNSIDYQIKSINEKTMVMEMTMNETPFQFTLEKKQPEELQ